MSPPPVLRSAGCEVMISSRTWTNQIGVRARDPLWTNGRSHQDEPQLVGEEVGLVEQLHGVQVGEHQLPDARRHGRLVLGPAARVGGVHVVVLTTNQQSASPGHVTSSGPMRAHHEDRDLDDPLLRAALAAPPGRLPAQPHHGALRHPQPRHVGPRETAPAPGDK